MAADTLRTLHLPALGAALVVCAGALLLSLDAQPLRLRSADGEASGAFEARDGSGLIGGARQASGFVGAREAPAAAAENPALEREVADLRLPGALPPLFVPTELPRTAREESEALIDELATAFERAVAVLSSLPLDFQGDPALAQQEADAIRSLSQDLARIKARAKALEGKLSSSDEEALTAHAGQRLGPLLEQLGALHPAAMERLSRALRDDGDDASKDQDVPEPRMPPEMAQEEIEMSAPEVDDVAEDIILR